MLTDLADVARAVGLTVVEADGWRTRGHGAMHPPRVVVLHHTAGPAAGDAPSLRVVRDGRPDLSGPLAHIVVGRSGTVHVVAAGLCWHTGATREPWQANAYAIGIEAENTGRADDRYPPAQLDAMVRLVRALTDRYDIPHVRVLGHREICDPPGRKIDPLPDTLDLDAFRAALAAPPEVDVSLSDTDVERIARRVADLVWLRPTRNGFGDVVEAQQIVNGIEVRTAELLDVAREGRAAVGGVDLDAFADRVVDRLAARLDG
jgi:hypothetical protein